MKKARSQKLKKFNKVLSVLLAAAMVAGSVPDVSLVAHATEAETEAAEEKTSLEEVDFLSEENVDTTDSDTADAVSESTSEEVSTAEEQQQPSEEAVPTEEEVSEEAVSTQEASSTEENKESEPTSDAVETESVNVSEDNTTGEEEVIADESIAPEAEKDGETNPTVTLPDAAAQESGHYTVTPDENNSGTTYKFTVIAEDGYKIKSVTAKQGEDAIELTTEDAADGNGKAYIIPAANMAAVANPVSIIVTIVAVEEFDVVFEAAAITSTYKYAVGDADKTPEDKDFANYDADTGVKAGNGEVVYVKVAEDIGKSVSVQYRGTDDNEDDTTAELVANTTDTYKVPITKNTTIQLSETFEGYVITLDKDKDSNYKSITYKIGNEEKSYTVQPNAQTVEIPKNQEVTFTVETKDADTAVKSFKAGNAEVTMTPAAGSTKYAPVKADYTFKVTGDTTVTLVAAPIYQVTFDMTDAADATVKYADTEDGAASSTDTYADAFFYCAGQIYFTVEAAANNAISSVTVGGTEISPKEVGEEKTSVYATPISADTKIVIQQKALHSVTTTVDTAANITKIEWAKTATAPAADWKEVTNENPIPEIKEGDKVYLKFTVAEGKIITKAAVGDIELEPVSANVYEVEVGKGNVAVAITTAEATAKHSLTFNLSAAQQATVKCSASQTDLKYENNTNPEIADLEAGKVYTFTVTPGSTIADGVTTNYVIKSVTVNSKELTPNNGTYSIRLSADTTVVIETAEALSVAFKYKEATDAANIDKIIYTTTSGPAPTKESDLKNTLSGTAITNVAKGDTVYFMVIPKAGFKASVTGKTATNNIYNTGAVNASIDEASAIEISTEAAYDVTFKTSVEDEVPTVKYFTVAKDAQAPTSITSVSFTETAVKGSIPELPEGTSVYFTIEVTGKTITALDNNLEPLELGDGTIYYVLSNITEDKTVTATVATINKVIFVTTDASRVTAFQTGDETKADITANGIDVKEGETLAFTLKMPANAQDNTKEDPRKVKGVVWTYTDARGRSITKPLKLTENNQYEIIPVAGSTNNQITITAAEYRDVSVTFTTTDGTTIAASKGIQASLSKDDFAADATTNPIDFTIDAAGTVAGGEDKTLYAKITAAEFYMVSKVTIPDADGEPSECEKDGDYYVIPLTGNMEDGALALTVTIETKLDALQQSTIDFGANTANDTSKEVKIAVTAADASKKVAYDADGKWITNAKKVSFTVDAVAGYEVTGITINGKEETLSYDQLDTINGVDGFTDVTKKTFEIDELNTTAEDGKITYNPATVVITTKKVAISNDKEINFTNSADGIATLAFKESDKEYTGNVKYKIPKGTTDFDFDVIVRGPYTAKVTYESTKELKPTGTKEVSANKTVYSYHVSAAQAADTYTISVKEDPKELTLSYDKSQINSIVVTDADGDELSISKLVSEDDGTKTVSYKALKGTEVTALVTIPANYALTGDGFALYTETETTRTYKLYIAGFSEDRKVVLKVAEEYEWTFATADEKAEVPAVDKKGNLVVSKNVKYQLTGKFGAADVEFTEADLTGITLEENQKPVLASGNKAVEVTIPASAAGKSLTFTATYKTGEATATKEIKFAVPKTITKVTVKGIKNGAADQAIATETSYGLTMSGVNDLSLLYAEVVNPTGTTVVSDAFINVSKKTLVVNTAAAKLDTLTGKTATINIYGKGEVDEQGAPKVLASFTVNPTAPVLTLKKLDLAAALHNGFVLKTTADSKIADAYNDKTVKVVYKTTVTGSAGEYQINNPYYADKEAKAASQNVTVGFTLPQGKNEKDQKASELTVKTSVVLVKVDENGSYEELAVGNEIEKTFSTKDPYYEDALKLTGKKTTVYTGEQDVIVALPKFSKNASYQIDDGKVDIYDASGVMLDNEEDENLYAEWTEEGIKLSIDPYAGKGTYTLKCYPYAGIDSGKENIYLYAAPASIKIKVVQGIYRIGTTPGSGENAAIYKAANKAGTYTVGIVYNNNWPDRKPQTAKVKAEIVPVNGNNDANIKKYVTYKNGKITVDKKYELMSDPRDNQFRVRLTPIDYSHDEDYVETGIFTITDQKTELGNVYFATKNGSVWNVLTGDKFTTDELYGASIIVTKSDVAAKEYYEVDDLADPGLYKIAISNKKMGLSRTGSSPYELLPGNQIAKNVKITVSPTDGGKGANKVLTFTTEYNKDALTLAVDGVHDSQGLVGVTMKGSEYHYSAATFDNYIDLHTVPGDKERLNTTATYNYSVTASGGKVTSWNKFDGFVKVIPSAKITKVKIQDKQNRSTKEYTFVNDAFVNAKAPNVTVEKKNLYAGLDAQQSIKLTSAKTDYRYAYISYDETDYQKALNNAKDYRNGTYTGIRGVGLVEPDDWNADGTFSKTITIPSDAVAGSYKLNVVFGTFDSNTNAFVPATAKKTVTIKVNKAVNFKATASYNLDPSVGFIELGGKPTEQITTVYSGSELKNANIGGQPNQFKDYFAIANGKIRLKAKLDEKGEETDTLYTIDELKEILKKDKNAFTGYVSYTDLKTGNTEWAKIKINVKAAAYKATDINTYAGASSAADITSITKGWSSVNVAYAYAESESGIAFAEIKDSRDTTTNHADLITGNKVRLTTTTAPAAGKYKVDLYIVDVSSSACATVAKAATNENIKKYGAKVTLNFNVLKPETKNKIKFTTTKVTFDEPDYDTSVVGWTKGNDKVNGTYELKYTLPSGVEIDSFKLADGSPDYLKAEQFKITQGSTTVGEDALLLTIDKAKLKAAEEAAKASKKTVLNKKVKVDVIATYKNGCAEDKIRFEITTPKTIQEYAEALSAVEAGYEAALAGLQLRSENQALVKRTVEGLTHLESGLRATVTKVSYQPATNENAGWYIVNVMVQNEDNGVTDKGAKTFNNIRMTVPVYNATQTLADAKSAVDSALSAYSTEHNGVVTNAITKEEILAIAQKVVTNPNIEVRYALIGGFNFAPATEDKAGSLDVKILLSRSIFERKTCTKSFAITKLDTISEAKTNVVAALNDATNKNLYGVKDEAGVLAAAKAAINNPNINVAFGTTDTEKFTLVTEVAEGTAGSYTGTIYLTQEGKREQKIVASASGDITGQIPAKDTAAQVVTRIEAAFKAYTDNGGKFTNSTTEAEVKAIADAANINSDYTIEYKPNNTTSTPEFKGFDVTKATVKAPGSIVATFLIKKGDASSTEKAVTLAIDQLSQSITEAKDAANAALADAEWVKTLTNATNAAAVKTQIETVVEGYTVTIGTDFKNTATATAAGTITATVTLDKAAGETDADKIVFTISISVPAPAATPAP